MRADTHVGLHVTYLLLLSDFNPNWNVTNLVRLPDIRFIEISFSGSRVILCGHGQADMTKRMDAFLRLFFAHRPKRSPRIGTKLDNTLDVTTVGGRT
jgi:hypothetical protein